MHDNWSSHTARVVRSFLEGHEIVVLPSPAQSPDLNQMKMYVHIGQTRLRQKINYLRAFHWSGTE